jgi:hypothetical protein
MKIENYIILFLMGGVAGHLFAKGLFELGLLCVVVIVFYIVYLISKDFRQ